MENHSYKVLEFDKLKEEISYDALIEETELKLIELRPYKDIISLKKDLEIIAEYIELVRYDGALELIGIKNIKSYLDKTKLVGTYLEAEEFYFLKENLKIFRKAKTKIDSLEDKYCSLARKFRDISLYKEIEDLIEKTIDEEKEIKETASLELKNIRTNRKLINENIKRKLENILNNPDNSNKIQDKLVTMREGRHVIPIKSNFKGQIKGIEHDRSGSGETIFIEPIAVVSLNNKLRELAVREREEIRKIFLRLTDIVRNNADGIYDMSQAILEIDFLNAKASYAIKQNCEIPIITEKEQLKLIKARHPFIDSEVVVPLSFEIGKDYNVMLITGPNTGGKTVTLKTAGLLTLMALSAIPVPCDPKSEIGMFNQIFADIGDEQSIEQNLSSFSGHLKNVKEILEKSNKKSLILLDELGSGTDPIEGAAFAMAVTDYLRERKSKVIISTHYSEVKAYGYNEAGVETASMEFDVETLSPTYKLLLGIPGKSNALTIASKLGINKEIIEKAEQYISEDDKKVEGMIANIHIKNEEIESTKDEVSQLKDEVLKVKLEYENKLIEIENEKNKLIEDAYAKAEDIVKNMQAKAKALVAKIQVEDLKKDEVKDTQKSLNMLKRALDEEKKKNIQKKKIVKNDMNLKSGDKVYIRSLNSDGIILRIVANKGEAQVQAGILKMMVKIDELEKVEEKKVKTYRPAHSVKRSNVKSEIDLRGKMIEEGIFELETYLDSAVFTKFQEVYIIHGKGTGKLRQGIQEYLKKSRYIKSFRLGNHNEGGIGVTVAVLKE